MVGLSDLVITSAGTWLPVLRRNKPDAGTSPRGLFQDHLVESLLSKLRAAEKRAPGAWCRNFPTYTKNVPAVVRPRGSAECGTTMMSKMSIQAIVRTIIAALKIEVLTDRPPRGTDNYTIKPPQAKLKFVFLLHTAGLTGQMPVNVVLTRKKFCTCGSSRESGGRLRRYQPTNRRVRFLEGSQSTALGVRV